MDEDFKVDLKQLVEDLQAKTNELEDLKKQIEDSSKSLSEKDELIKSLTEKTETLEKTNSDLYLKIAQNITQPPVVEEKKTEETISLNDIINELGKGI